MGLFTDDFKLSAAEARAVQAETLLAELLLWTEPGNVATDDYLEFRARARVLLDPQKDPR